MKNIKLFAKAIVILMLQILLIFFVLSVFLCSPVNNEFRPNNFPIRLTLEDKTHTQAYFSGNPIKAFIEFNDSVAFDEIAWHLGAGHYRHTNIAPTQKIKQAEVELFWTSMPLNRDTLKKVFFDTVYISIDGETKRSNSVKIYITNIAPVIDSIKIGNKSYQIGDTARYYLSFTDTTSILLIKAFCHDINKDTLRYDWYSSRLHSSFLPLQRIYYSIPSNEFKDTITLTTYDGKGGNNSKVIIIGKFGQNNLPTIDSINVNSTTFKDINSSIFKYYSQTYDTLKFMVYASDKDKGDSLFVSWRNTSAKNNKIISQNGFFMTLICDTMYKKVTLADRLVDTVYITVKDSKADSVKKMIIIIQNKKNNPPQIDSVKIDSSYILKGSEITATYISSVRDTILITSYFYDADSDSLSFYCLGKIPSQYSKISGNIYKYYCKDSLYKDTLLLVVKDIKGDSAKKNLIIDIANRYPLIDSLKLTYKKASAKIDTIFKDTNKTYFLIDSLTAADTSDFIIYCHDNDNFGSQKDSIYSINWTSSAKANFIKNNDSSSVKYICKNQAYKDTIIVMVSDIKQKKAKKTLIVNIRE